MCVKGGRAFTFLTALQLNGKHKEAGSLIMLHLSSLPARLDICVSIHHSINTLQASINQLTRSAQVLFHGVNRIYSLWHLK